MDVRQAIYDTMELAHKSSSRAHPVYEVTYDHLCIMHEKIDLDRTMSDAKLNRWLGWMQATIVSWGTHTLEDMKEINKRNDL